MILLVYEKSGIFLKSITERLESVHKDVKISYLSVEELSKMENPEAVILFADGNLSGHEDALLYIRDKLIDNNIYFFVVGQLDEIKVVTDSIPDSLVTKFFKRPFNVSEAVSEIGHIIKKGIGDNREKILVVDDSGVVLRDIKAWLGDKYKVFMADSGMKAIQFLTGTIPDLILLDYEMPIMDGRQVLELLKNDEQFSKIPVIFLTGKNDAKSVKKVLELKPDGYILKGSGADKIINEVDTFFIKQKMHKK